MTWPEVSDIKNPRFTFCRHWWPHHIPKFHNFPWNIVAVVRLESYFVVGSLDLTWWPDLTWHWVKIFTKVAENMGKPVFPVKPVKHGWKPALPYFRYPRKPEGGGGRSSATPPPPQQGTGLHAHWRGGGAKNAHPSGFSRVTEKRRRAAPPFFQYLLTIELDTLCKNLSLRSPKVRLPGQVKVKNGFLNLRLRSGHSMYPIGFKRSAFHEVIDTYNLYISDFWYLWPEVKSISWPHHYKSMGRNSNRSYWMIMHQNHLYPS